MESYTPEALAWFTRKKKTAPQNSAGSKFEKSTIIFKYSPKLFWREMYLHNHHLTKGRCQHRFFGGGGIGFLRDVSKRPQNFQPKKNLGGDFKDFFFSLLFGGRFPICLIFFKGVGSTTNQFQQVGTHYHPSTDLDLAVGGALFEKRPKGKSRDQR